MAIILIIKEDTKRHEVTLNEQPFVIGRSRKSDLKINDAKLSGTHCSVKLNEGMAFITDLDSTNGTTLNSNSVKQSHIHLNDIIKVGNTSLFLLKKKMTSDELSLHASNSDSPASQPPLKTEGTSSKIQKIKAARKSRVKSSKAPVPEHIKAKHEIKQKKAKGFAVLTRILKIK